MKDSIGKIFGGKLLNSITGSCGHESTNQEQFLEICIPVNKKNLKDGLSALMHESFTQDNQYFCNSCNAKVDAEKSTVFDILPNHLIFVLKRFEFDC